MFAVPVVVDAVCADDRPVNLNVGRTTVSLSPDCSWEVVSVGDDDIESGNYRLAHPYLPELTEASPSRAFVVERATGKVISNFEMERSASVHWLKGGRHLVVNSFEGSGSDIPLVFVLEPGSLRQPLDLAALVWPSVLKRAGLSDAPRFGASHRVYHYYVDFIEDAGDRLIISAEPWYTLKGEDGPGASKCYIYSISKTTFRYSFVREESGNCPKNPDEHRD